MLQFYSMFIGPNDLCFDVGANFGNRTKIFLQLGARVVAIEPQRDCVALLKAAHGTNSQFEIVQKAVSAHEGVAVLEICNLNMLSSMSPEWIKAVQQSGRFSEYSWETKERVETVTLDSLIDSFGVPSFIKIDVEGSEWEVVKGLSRLVRTLSIEFTPEFMEQTFKCIERLRSLGDIQLNYSVGESMKLVHDSWLSPPQMISILADLQRDHTIFGDVYVQCKDCC